MGKTALVSPLHDFGLPGVICAQTVWVGVDAGAAEVQPVGVPAGLDGEAGIAMTVSMGMDRE